MKLTRIALEAQLVLCCDVLFNQMGTHNSSTTTRIIILNLAGKIILNYFHRSLLLPYHFYSVLDKFREIPERLR